MPQRSRNLRSKSSCTLKCIAISNIGERERESCVYSKNTGNQEADRQGHCIETVAHPLAILIKPSTLGQQLVTMKKIKALLPGTLAGSMDELRTAPGPPSVRRCRCRGHHCDGQTKLCTSRRHTSLAVTRSDGFTRPAARLGSGPACGGGRAAGGVGDPPARAGGLLATVHRARGCDGNQTRGRAFALMLSSIRSYRSMRCRVQEL